MKTLILSLFLGVLFNPIQTIQPDYGSIEDIKSLKKIFIRTEDDDDRKVIVKMIGAYEGLEIVNNMKDAEILLDLTTLTRDVAPNRGPRAVGASMALKSQMRAHAIRPDGSTVIAWTETETLDTVNTFTLSAPNEMNLTHHFVRDLQKARGEKPYSIRQLAKGKPKEKRINQ